MSVEMPKRYDHKEVEPRIYKMWEDGEYFKAERDPNKEPYTIILPPPNASGKMHTGNVLMIAIEDLLIRWKRMQGYSALWVPGTDHAGFETQTTYERELKKQGKTRFDFDRKTLYDKMMEFVAQNKSDIEQQIRSMGASVDWSRYTFTLDDRSIDTVVSTFEKMEKEGFVYRDDYVVNYSFKWGTTFSDAETNYKEQTDSLYYIKYGPLTVATVRPETTLGDTALAVNPDDPRYQDYIGKEVEVELATGPRMLKVIGDSYVDPEFGTGVLKVTPAHDKNDYEISLRHDLEIINVIGINGRMNKNAGKYEDMPVLKAREAIVAELQEKGLVEHIDENYLHVVPVDYRSGDYIEQLVLPNWFVKVEGLKEPALQAVLDGELKIYPKWREITYVRWMENMRNWPVSRQVVWGIRIPAWYNVDDNPNIFVTFLNKDGVSEQGTIAGLLEKYSLEDIESGIQTLIAPKGATYEISKTNPGERFLQETDTFDTWFSSGQWPLITLGYPDSEDFEYFYPSSVLETGWEIVTRWVSRMVMFGMYLTGKPPFKDVYLHGIVFARDGKKMSKSLGNVINPESYQEEYGTDALRMGLISGTAIGRDFSFPHDKVLAYRNFANKLWNMARFMLMMLDKHQEETGKEVPFYTSELVGSLHEKDHEILVEYSKLVKSVTENLEKYRFADAGDAIYHFMWDLLASDYIEHVKDREDKDVALSVLRHVYLNSLKLLHPFMPFVSEEIWGIIPQKTNEPLVITQWPDY